jgi:hypothetical protein
VINIGEALAFGDPYLANQYYFVVSTWALLLNVAFLILLPWFVVRSYGLGGLKWAVAGIVVYIAVQYMFLRTQLPSDADTADAIGMLCMRLALLQLMIGLPSALLTWLWYRSAGQPD